MHQNRIQELEELLKAQRQEAEQKEESYQKALHDQRNEKEKKHRQYTSQQKRTIKAYISIIRC